MRLPFCPYEEKIARLLNENRWDSDPALLVHAGKCARCSEVVLSVQTLQHNRANTMMLSRAGSPGNLWWRAQLRRQNGMLEQIAKPLVWTEWLALCSMLCLAAGFAFWQWGQIGNWFSKLRLILGTPVFHLGEIWLRATQEYSLIWLPILAGLTAIACICGLALLLSDQKE
jgi:hypothetical protein